MRINRSALADFRELNELTKSELADEAGISLQYYCDLESGHRPGTPKVIGSIARALKVKKKSIIVDPDAFDEGES